jgi:hypothetical protein
MVEIPIKTIKERKSSVLSLTEVAIKEKYAQ